MLRTPAVALALLLAGCAHERTRDPSDPAVVATAQFLIQTIAPLDNEDYRWSAVDARVANAVRWNTPESGEADGVAMRRTGTLNIDGAARELVALGNDATVGAFSLDTDAFAASALLDALRAAGAEVAFQGDFETYAEYVIVPAGGDTALLTTNSTCSPFESPPPSRCRNFVTLTFNPF